MQSRNSLKELPLPATALAWQPWRETIGFVIRRITYRSPSYWTDYQRERASSFYLIEFDILDGCSGYHTTGFLGLDAETLKPIAKITGIPLPFEAAIAPSRIFTVLDMDTAQKRIVEYCSFLIRTGDEQSDARKSPVGRDFES